MARTACPSRPISSFRKGELRQTPFEAETYDDEKTKRAPTLVFRSGGFGPPGESRLVAGRKTRQFDVHLTELGCFPVSDRTVLLFA